MFLFICVVSVDRCYFPSFANSVFCLTDRSITTGSSAHLFKNEFKIIGPRGFLVLAFWATSGTCFDVLIHVRICLFSFVYLFVFIGLFIRSDKRRGSNAFEASCGAK